LSALNEYMLEINEGESMNRQSRDTGNIEHTRHRTNTNKAHTKTPHTSENQKDEQH